jgi:uncharacterized protein YfkK (UPF0435 family)
MKTKQTSCNRPVITVMAAFILLALSFPVLAQEQQPRQSEQQQLQVTDAKLEAVAKAYLEVAEVQSVYKPRIDSALSAEEAQQIAQEAMREIVEIVEKEEGVSVQEFDEIVTAAQTDQQLRERLAIQVLKAQEEKKNTKKDDETSE